MIRGGIFMDKKTFKVLSIIISCGFILILINFCTKRIYAETNICESEMPSTTDMDSELQSLLTDYNITISGQSAELTHVQLDGLLDMVPIEDYKIIDKYTKISEDYTGKISLTKEQLFEVIYYSSSLDWRWSLLSGSKNSDIQVLSDDNGAIGLGYNSQGTVQYE